MARHLLRFSKLVVSQEDVGWPAATTVPLCRPRQYFPRQNRPDRQSRESHPSDPSDRKMRRGVNMFQEFEATAG
jgi:hypothetical protein